MITRRIISIFLVFSLIAVYPLLYAQDSLDLNALLDEAARNNPELQAAQKRYEAAKARIPQAKSLEDPRLEFKFEKSKGNPFNLSTSPAMDRMLSIEQMIPFFGRLPLKGKIALVESQMIAGEYKDKELGIINEVKKAYYDLYLNHREIELNEQSLLLLEGIAKITEANYVVSDMPQEAVFKINLEIARLNNDIRNLREGQSAKITRINTLLDRKPEESLGAPKLDEEISFNKDIATLYKFTIENQPVLLIFSYAIEKNKHAKSLAKKSFFPDLMAKIAMRGITTGSIGPWDLMLAFSVPIWFWTKQRYEVKEAIANLEQARLAYEGMKNKALYETKKLASDIEIARNKVKLYKNNLIPILQSSINSSLSAIRAGKGDIMMLLDNQRMLINIKMSYYRALVEYNTNLADLERQVGIVLR